MCGEEHQRPSHEFIQNVMQISRTPSSASRQSDSQIRSSDESMVSAEWEGHSLTLSLCTMHE